MKGACTPTCRCQNPETPLSQAALFALPPAEARPTVEPPAGRPRVEQANRAQVEWRSVALDALLTDDHRATSEGVGSARALARLCEEHVAYQWLRGGVSVNYHTLADFRTAHVEVLDTLLTHSVATLMAAGVVTLTRVAQDGMRVQASAGAASFRRRGSLARCLAEAEAQVQALRAEVGTDPTATSQRQRAARVSRALAQLSALEAARARAPREAGREPSPPRASTTDPDALVMKMADGGFRPAYNSQFATVPGA